MASDELMKQYKECNERLTEAGRNLQSADSFGKAEVAKDEYYLAAFGMLMIQNHLLLEMMESICHRLGLDKKE